MTGPQLAKFTGAIGLGSAVFGRFFTTLAQPANTRRLRAGLTALALVWMVFAITQLIWSLYPSSEDVLPSDLVVLNPQILTTAALRADPVDINTLISWHLLGTAAEVSTEPSAAPEVSQTTGREGIEDGAKETRLNLRLRGIIASSADGLGHAIIEHKSKQQVYAVEDKLPISGRVILAKVMPDRVIIDNRGTYELLALFEDNGLSLVPTAKKIASKANVSALRAVDKRKNTKVTRLAKSYRERLYSNPQSLADLVSVSAVRENGILQGYKVSPGSDAAQFKQMGFETGDVITSVNGIALNDPGNTIRLYQLMRSAEEAVFDLERKGQPLSVSVSLTDAGGEQ